MLRTGPRYEMLRSAQHDKDRPFPLPVMLSGAKRSRSIPYPIPVRNVSELFQWIKRPFWSWLTLSGSCGPERARLASPCL